MLTVQEQLLYTTLRIECFDSNKRLYSIGTGFLLSRPVDENAIKIYLVSNKHVLVGAESIALTFTHMKNGEPEHGNNLRFPIDNVGANVVGHPNPNVDIAVLECTGLFVMLQDQLFVKAVSYDMLSDFTEPELNVAENVLFVGYPDNRYDAITECDGLILITEWKEFRNPDFNMLSDKLNEKVIFDGRNIYNKKISEIGFELFQIGC